MYIFGVDVGGTAIKIGAFDEKYNLLDKWQIPTNTEKKGEYIMTDIANSISKYVEGKKANVSDVKGIGFGIPGPVIDNTVKLCVNLGWKDVNIEQSFIKVFKRDVKIIAENDAKVAALGEYYYLDNCNNAVMITLGTGFGCGIIVDKHILNGFNGCAGEIGHVKIDSKYNFNCCCGQTGCMETVCSATGMMNIFRSNYDKYLTTLPKDALPKMIFEAAGNGDSLGAFVVDELADYIGHALAIIAGVINPEVFIIGGGLSKNGELLLSKIRFAFKKYALEIFKDTKIQLANLSNDAGIYGAVRLI